MRFRRLSPVRTPVNALGPSLSNDPRAVPSGGLRPPRAAAVAGIIFSVLMVLSLGIIRTAAPAGLSDHGWLTDPVMRRLLSLALNMVPFAGVAFLWFIGVLRSRLGKLEDQFFATVLLGSGLMFVASLFGAAAISGALLEEATSPHGHLLSVETYVLARRVAHALLNVFAVKMAAVFTFSTCAIVLRTAILPRWLAFSGFACGLVLLLVITNWEWIVLLFPLWLLLVSTHVLVADLRHGHIK